MDIGLTIRRFSPGRASTQIEVPVGQLRFEWLHLAKKLGNRNPKLYAAQLANAIPVPHPLFRAVRGEVAPWERGG